MEGNVSLCPNPSSPDARLHHNDVEDEALLLVRSIEHRVAAIADVKMNSSEDHRW
jgi:hypothetical protein